TYDTPVASMGGIELFDELFMFSGMQDRFDFKLVGKKEMYIPYNNYELYFDCNADTQLMASHLNPECERWELHRVWEVEATLKEGRRHVYSKRTYYLDEDTYGAGLYDAWDQSGQLYRSMMLGGVQLYDHDIPYIVKHVIYDFNRGMYGLINDALAGGYKVLESPRSERELNPEAIVSRESVRYPKQLWCGPQGERYREQLSPSGDAVQTQDASGLLRVRIMTISCWLESSPTKRSISLAVACFLYLGLGSFSVLASETKSESSRGLHDPLEQPSIIQDLSRPQPAVAIAQAGGNLVSVGLRGLIMISSDGGNSWSPSTSPVA